MKQILQIIDRLGEWIILSFLWILSSTLTLGVGVGVSFLALELTLWRPASDHQGYLVRNYIGHLKRWFKLRYILMTTLPLLGIGFSSVMLTFLLSQPPSLFASVLILGQVLISIYLASVFLQMPRVVIQTNTLPWTLALIAPLRLPMASLLYLLSTILLALTPIYVSFAIIFIVVPMIVELHIWIGKKVNH
ncbi:MAG: hypothetical protein ACO3C8_04070 [Bacilli bacterium]